MRLEQNLQLQLDVEAVERLAHRPVDRDSANFGYRFVCRPTSTRSSQLRLVRGTACPVKAGDSSRHDATLRARRR